MSRPVKTSRRASGDRARGACTVHLPRTGFRHPIDKLAALRDQAVFHALSPGVIEHLAAYMTRRRVAQGSTIFAKGDPGATLMAVLSGSVRISVSGGDGRETVLNIIKPGQMFGEIALLDGRARTADAAAMTDCELLAIDRRDFIPLLRRDPDLLLELIETLCARIRRTSVQVEDAMYLSLSARLAKALLELSGGAEASAARRNVRITQLELGNIVGMSRETTNRQLRAWEAREWVRLERGSIAVLDTAALMRLAG